MISINIFIISMINSMTDKFVVPIDPAIFEDKAQLVAVIALRTEYNNDLIVHLPT